MIMGMLIREFFDKICDMFKGIVNFFKKHSKKDEDLKQPDISQYKIQENDTNT